MALHAWAINTGSSFQGGTGQPGLDPRYISGANNTNISGPTPRWYDYRILAKARLPEEQNLGLVIADPLCVLTGLEYWNTVNANITVIDTQKGFYLPRYREGITSDQRDATVSTSSWQWVQGLDSTIKQLNEGTPGNEYYPGNYGWILGVCRNGTTNGFNVEAWFWGSPGENGGTDPKGEQSFVQVVNSLPTGAYQPLQANERDNTTGAEAWGTIGYSVESRNNITEGQNIGNFIVIYNTGSTLSDVSFRDSLNLMTASIWV
jgi:hypothetical protein